MMKNLKLVLPLFTLVLALGLVFTQSTFKVSNKSTTLRYRYIGNDEAGLKTLSNWQEIAPGDTPSICETGTELPCLVSFEDNEYSDIVAFYNANGTSSAMFSSNRVVNKKN